MTMITKLARVVIYRSKHAPIKLHDPLVTLSCEVKWQVEYTIFSFAKNHQYKTRHDGDLPWQALTLNTTWRHVDNKTN